MSYCEHKDCREDALVEFEFILTILGKPGPDGYQDIIRRSQVRCRHNPRGSICGTGAFAPLPPLPENT